jgi:DNA mismatch repair protein MSH5
MFTLHSLLDLLCAPTLHLELMMMQYRFHFGVKVLVTLLDRRVKHPTKPFGRHALGALFIAPSLTPTNHHQPHHPHSTMPPFKMPFCETSSHRNASFRSANRHRIPSSTNSHFSASTITPDPYAQTQRTLFANGSISDGAQSKTVARDSELGDVHDDDTRDEVIMAIDLTARGTVGCCYYVAKDEKLFFMEDIQFGDVDVVEALRTFIDPTVILVSTKIDDAVINRFDPEAKSDGSVSGDKDQFRLPFLLEVRPPSDFLYDVARSKLVNLHLGKEDGTQISFNAPGDLGARDYPIKDNVACQQGQLLRLAGWVNIESRVTVGLHYTNMHYQD